MNNVYIKLMEMRTEFHAREFKKTGHNSYSNYYYFELSDFLPTALTLLEKHKLATFISFTKEEAILTLVNAEKPEEKIIFTSPMSEAKLKACHEVQNLGAVQTYIRRYLYVNLLEIVEHDELDAMTGKEEKQNQNNETSTTNTSAGYELTDKQIKRLYALAYKAGYDKAKVDEMVLKKFNKKPSELDKTAYDQVCQGFEAKTNTTN